MLAVSQFQHTAFRRVPHSLLLDVTPISTSCTSTTASGVLGYQTKAHCPSTLFATKDTLFAKKPFVGTLITPTRLEVFGCSSSEEVLQLRLHIASVGRCGRRGRHVDHACVMLALVLYFDSMAHLHRVSVSQACVNRRVSECLHHNATRSCRQDTFLGCSPYTLVTEGEGASSDSTSDCFA